MQMAAQLASIWAQENEGAEAEETTQPVADSARHCQSNCYEYALHVVKTSQGIHP